MKDIDVIDLFKTLKIAEGTGETALTISPVLQDVA